MGVIGLTVRLWGYNGVSGSHWGGSGVAVGWQWGQWGQQWGQWGGSGVAVGSAVRGVALQFYGDFGDIVKALLVAARRMDRAEWGRTVLLSLQQVGPTALPHNHGPIARPYSTAL